MTQRMKWISGVVLMAGLSVSMIACQQDDKKSVSAVKGAGGGSAAVAAIPESVANEGKAIQGEWTVSFVESTDSQGYTSYNQGSTYDYITGVQSSFNFVINQGSVNLVKVTGNTSSVESSYTMANKCTASDSQNYTCVSISAGGTVVGQVEYSQTYAIMYIKILSASGVTTYSAYKK